ncbi:MAG TPA: DUF3347 domain-containing protein [Opitutaceae bacterium]|nr:DUF3347 domain-containing protein [Opitutaceae bacterium]
MTTLRIFVVFLLAGGLAVIGALAGENQSPLLPLYERVALALSADDLAGAQAAARNLAAEAAKAADRDMASSANAVAHAGDLVRARASFKSLSAQAISLARHTKGYFILTCPMAQADWVQSTRTVANPYLGQTMLTCGEVKEETKG